jgi:hypothetical protein
MKPLALFVTLVLSLSPAIAYATEEENTALPFSVSLGGQAAKAVAGSPFAKVEKPVAANAALEVGASGMIIINIASANEKGEPTEGATPAVIVIQSGNKTTLDKTMDGKKFSPGNYHMAVVADGKTASVAFKIQ